MKSKLKQYNIIPFSVFILLPSLSIIPFLMESVEWLLHVQLRLLLNF